jgi:2-polyprenyl-3-methyl-5-hydroxy-6-metoxy-1,4-benzoquinol methylase
LEDLINIANENKLDIHNFKNSKLPRVEKVIGMLKGIRPPSILDIGFGRGKFLYPLLEEFDNYNITALELNKKSIEEAKVLQNRYTKLKVIESDFLTNPLYMGKAFHTITALEVMEHIEDTEKFLDECVRLAYEWIILSVPSKEDNNPEHIHLFTEEKINKLFKKYNLTPKYEYVLNHMIIKIKL